MEKLFRVKMAKDQLSAQLELVDKLDDSYSITARELENLLIQEKIVFGIDQQKLKDIADDPKSVDFPVTIAKGIPPKNGEDAYITVEIQEEKEMKKEKINFRNVIDIPSVKSGQIIANIVTQTYGSNGTSILGRQIAGRNGRPLRIRAGKNVVQTGNQFLSTIAGQVSITEKMISVNPVFEVRGDLDLKTGNINFIGNVVIRGNVPTGYEVIAGGDIKVYGLVEGAHLEAKGNIFISGGITGGFRGTVVAGGNIQATYLNQAEVKASEDVIIYSSLLHSKVQASGSILCKTGRIIGGRLQVGKDIHAKEIGNHLYTKTELNIGYDPVLDEKEFKTKQKIEEISQNLTKLNEIEAMLIETAKVKGKISEKDKELILKQRVTKNHLMEELNDWKKQLAELEVERYENGKSCAYIYGVAYPNTTFHFGKYSKSLQREHSYMKFFVANGEIIFEPIG